MKILIEQKNYFDWEIPEILTAGKDTSDPYVIQCLIDEYFDKNDEYVQKFDDDSRYMYKCIVEKDI